MATAAELRARREALTAQRSSSGVARVSYDGKTVDYRSVAEIDRAIEVLDREIATAEGRKIIRQVRVIDHEGAVTHGLASTRFRRRGTGGPAAVRARLEGAMSQRRLRGWKPPLENINSLIASGGPRLLARSRELVVTNGYAANACEAFASNLVGDGIKPSSLIEDPALRDQVQRLWLAWTDEADADGLTDFYGLQAMVAREMFVAGECFVRLRPRRAEDGLLVPIQLQLAAIRDAALREDRDGGQRQPHPLRDRVRCHRPPRGLPLPPPPSRRQHRPGGGHAGDGARAGGDVLHIYRPIDAGQIRGLPHVAPAMVRLFLLDQYDDAELDRKKTAAMFAGFITKTAPEEPMMGEIEAIRRGAPSSASSPARCRCCCRART
jgi:lambda family phage portal protein